MDTQQVKPAGWKTVVGTNSVWDGVRVYAMRDDVFPSNDPRTVLVMTADDAPLRIFNVNNLQ